MEIKGENLGAIAADAAIYRFWPVIRGDAKYLWELVAKSGEMAEAKTIVRHALNGKVLADQLRHAAICGLGLIVVGLLIGRYGYSLQSADPLQNNWVNKIGYAIRSFGSIVRGLGTLYAAVWLGIVVFKAEVVIKGLSISGSALNKARKLLAILSPDFVGLDQLITEGEIFSAKNGEKERKAFLSLFIWVVTIGTVTQLDSLLPLDTSIGSFITFICALIGIYAISVYFGKNHIMIAFGVNVAAIVGLLLMVFFNSTVYAKMSAAYKDTDHYRANARQAAIERIKNGIEKPEDKDLVGDEVVEGLSSADRPAKLIKATARSLRAGEVSSDDEKVLGKTITGDIRAIIKIQAQSSLDLCDYEEIAAHSKRAEEIAHGKVLSQVRIPNCTKERSDARERVSELGEDPEHEKRDKDLLGLAEYTKLKKAKDKKSGAKTASPKGEVQKNDSVTDTAKAAPKSSGMSEDQIAQEALRQTLAKYGDAL